MALHQRFRAHSTSAFFSDESARRRRGLSSWVVVPAVLVVGMLLFVMWAPLTRTREGARRSTCKNNLKQIGIALHNYHDVYDSFPPAYTVDAEGRPLHSWRTLILPYLEQRSLYERIDLTKPWDDPANQPAFEQMPPVYVCPSSDGANFQTTYFGIVTSESCLQPGQSHSLKDIRDGLSNTLLVIEVDPAQAAPWMAPVDADESLLQQLGEVAEAAHAGGRFGTNADGSGRYLTSRDWPQNIRAFSTIAAGDTPVEDAY